ncbi:LamG-like jellyroll fold domain-containing protein [Geofilum sp. OHC36d9]|uniref:LamG-like jellyroll fold domain-containing protein n=1 Tax=Geofilum sp. OHC36d9 TaxID=3458413 RepID=UPI004033700B
MKLTNRLLLMLAIFGLQGIWSCQEWGEMDPEAGNQVYPKLVLKGEYEFDPGSLDEVVLGSYESGQEPKIVSDEFKGKVVQLSGGYIQFINPLKNVSLQTGASLTMWVKTSEGNLNGAIFSFANEDDSEKLFFTPNGWLSYTSEDDSYEVNNPADVETDLLIADEWHYLAIIIKTNGYIIYVDGESKLEATIIDYDFSKIIEAFSNFSYLYLGYGSSTQPQPMWIDDLMIYRNVITEKEIAVPEVSNVAEPYEFPPRGTVGYYKLDNSFINSLNELQDGELVTVQTQATPSAYEEDPERGTVWHQQEGWTDHANGWAYTRFDNPLNGQAVEDGVSVSMWINPPTLNWWDQIFVLNDGTSKFWFNAIGYLGYNGTGGYFDCQNNNDENALEVGVWTFVTINITNGGFQVYYNGELKFDLENNAAYGGDLADFSNVVNMFTSSSDFYLGYETWWKAAPALVDDIFLITRPITEDEIKNLYADTNKSNGGVITSPAYLPNLYGTYTLDNTFENALNSSQSGEFITVEAQATPSGFEEDAERGIVWHQQEGWTGNENGWAYTRFDNPLKGKTVENDGISVSMWINPPTLNWWDQIFVLNDGTSKFWFNAIGYLGYNGTGGYFDCHNNNDENALEVGKWTLVSINITNSGFEVYYNGELKFDFENNAAYAGDITDFSNVVNMFTSSSDFYLGYETWWKAAPALVDDINICASPLTAEQAIALYNATKK